MPEDGLSTGQNM